MRIAAQRRVADGYIGESTRGEIAYAHEHGKDITFLEPIPLDGVAAALGVET